MAAKKEYKMININAGELFKQAGSLITKNWQMLALLAMVVVFFMTKNDYGALKKSMNIMSTSYQEQIVAIESSHREELKLREQTINKYKKELEELTIKFDNGIENINKERQKNIDKFKRDFTEQPDELAREISEQFGFSYVE
tara:strand:+ start:49 stop:474 length:426 start_codon:yes stop_codon:yes gene_type:complete